MNELTLQWYHSLIAGLSLDPQTFQLYQGSASLGTQSEWLWDILDAIPPESVNNYYNPIQANLFSQNYAAVIGQLLPISTNDFQNCMGDYYGIWNTYLHSMTLPLNFYCDPKVMSQVFTSWATANAPIKINCVQNLIKMFFGDIVTKANVLYANATAQKKALAYGITMNEVQTKINAASGASITFDNSQPRRKMSTAWTQKTQVKDLNFFGAPDQIQKFNSNTLSSLSKKVVSNTITIQATYDHVLCIEGHPLQTKSLHPLLSSYLPWFSPAAFARAYGTKDNTVWKHGSPSWETTFGPSGNMQRDTFGLVIVDGMDVHMQSTATYSQAEQRAATTAKVSGVWPFYMNEITNTVQNDVTFNAQGEMVIHTTSKVGNPQLIGVNINTLNAITNTKTIQLNI
jgi:hypothetical protein